MSDINIVCLTGRLADEPELRFTNSGYGVLKFSLAFNRSVKADGRWEERGNFIDCTVFGKRAESLADILKKGMQVTVSAQLEQQRWEHDGHKRSKICLTVEDLKLPSKGAQTARDGAPERIQEEQPYYEQDIPF